MSLLDRTLTSVVRLGQGLATRILGATPPVTRSTRYQALDALESLYWGRQYEGKGLATPWDKQPSQARYVPPLREQRPSVQYDLPRVIVDRPTALLFGEGRFPEVSLEGDEDPEAIRAVNRWLTQIVDEGALPHTALAWARQGGRLGTAVLTWAIVEGEFEFEPHLALYCEPTFHRRKRNRLIQLEKRYKFRRQVPEVVMGVMTLVDKEFWHRELWDEERHVVYKEVPVGDGAEPDWPIDDEILHGFGFVPAVWVKNLDDGDSSKTDGISLLEGLADVMESIDRTLTQTDRAIRYNQDPERIYYGLREGDRDKLQSGGGATTALPPKPQGGVELVELRGEGQRIALDHINGQRGRVLEVSRVILPDPERLLAAARSGAALRILHAPTIELVGELRENYGQALRQILEQILRAAREGTLQVLGRLSTPPPAVIPPGKVTLLWGDYFEPTPEDLRVIAETVAALRGVLDHETLVRYLASYFGIRDVNAVMERLGRTERTEQGPGTRPETPVNSDGTGPVQTG